MGCSCSSGVSVFDVKRIVSNDSDGVEDHDMGTYSPGEVPDGLSYVGGAALDVLNWKHSNHKGVCWNLSHGRIVGEVAQTPPKEYWRDAKITEENAVTHSDEFPARMAAVIAKAEKFVDFASLGVPDGKFLSCIVKALQKLDKSHKRVKIRFLTGNIIGMPTDNEAILKELTQNESGAIRPATTLQLWVGSWRKGLSWNHSKIVAVDGKYLFQGGHNVWDAHYLQHNPVRDVSMEAEGHITHDAHVFCNRMWEYIYRKENLRKLRQNDVIPKVRTVNTSIFSWPPILAPRRPPMYKANSQPWDIPYALLKGDIPMLSIGRYGSLHKNVHCANPSDSAIAAMLCSAKQSIKMSLQDLGPIAVPLPTGAVSIPGGAWPQEYMRALGKAIFERGVNVYISLSPPNSIPADLSPLDANYGNGWTCEDVASEIVKCMKKGGNSENQDVLRDLIKLNLHVSYMRATCGTHDWEKNGKVANHSKIFIVDDICYYIGSQNLYIADLAEWGIIIDDAAQTQKILADYWEPMWDMSFARLPEASRDCNVEKVLKGCSLDRSALPDESCSPETREAILLKKLAHRAGGATKRLTVWVHSATDLRNADTCGISDPYVILQIYDQNGQKMQPDQKTMIINRGGRNPTWNEQLCFEGLKHPEELTLKAVVWDSDTIFGVNFSPDDHLGDCTIPLHDLSMTPGFEERTLTFDNGKGKTASLRMGLCTHAEWGTLAV